MKKGKIMLKRNSKTKKLFPTLILGSGVFFISVGFLFSCGFVSDDSAPQGSFLDSENTENSDGVFNSPEGRLDSADKCFRNDACVELCDSMLENFRDQKECYDHTETEVQAFRDTYNLLALGNSRKLEQVTPEEMEDFLAFGPALWRDAIYGFERGVKENCTVNLDPPDPRDREDCKLENYYKQPGYNGEGASTGLSWIARNKWLADLIDEYDEDEEVMNALLDILSTGVKDSNRDKEDSTICQVGSGNSFAEPAPSDFPFSLDADLKLYQALGNSNCVEGNSYFNLALEEENDPALLVGYETLKAICNRASETADDACEKYFFCHADHVAILSYVNNKKLFQGFDITQASCN